MLNKLIKEKHIFKFSKNNEPAMIIKDGDVVDIETMDCFSNQLQTPEDSLVTMDWERVNPATGPIYIEGACPGDVLKVTIEDIMLAEQGVMAAGKDLGVLGDLLTGLTSKIVPIKNGRAVFDTKVSLPVSPMIGVIGVAPAAADINTGTPGEHGGNMDNTLITAGASLYLPIFVKGALFSLGDLHAVMGDGEIGVTGVEISGIVRTKLEIIKGLDIHNPILENENSLITIASAERLDEAVNKSVHDMAKLISQKVNLSMNDIAMLLSIAGSTQICQVVDPLKTARFVVPKWVLNAYNFKL